MRKGKGALQRGKRMALLLRGKGVNHWKSVWKKRRNLWRNHRRNHRRNLACGRKLLRPIMTPNLMVCA